MSAIDPVIEASWKATLQEEFQKDYFLRLKEFLIHEKQNYQVYPSSSHIFKAFELTPFDKVKVVILGQDPYHGEGQAHGLAFSVPDGIRTPPSLQNIFKELASDLGVHDSFSNRLDRWARQGVLLLNATLTVRAHAAGSHQKKGWEEFTDEVIRQLSAKRNHLVFILWGSYAHSKLTLINQDKHLVIKSAHPSPLSAYRGFFGSKPFSKTNYYLQQHGIEAINWRAQ